MSCLLLNEATDSEGEKGKRSFLPQSGDIAKFHDKPMPLPLYYQVIWIENHPGPSTRGPGLSGKFLGRERRDNSSWVGFWRRDSPSGIPNGFQSLLSMAHPTLRITLIGLLQFSANELSKCRIRCGYTQKVLSRVQEAVSRNYRRGPILLCDPLPRLVWQHTGTRDFPGKIQSHGASHGTSTAPNFSPDAIRWLDFIAARKNEI
ncbi:hypothetical protein HNY73_021321 [Argiope bruennichi]|uniref:Uncharacterized protein n=1 Tax=Argiope bruennichi TaxID=94029 RepID=A0A8T0DXX1_ARGBR|nr:hypothetical protein HNY73_021321 [Argiope bruennichi]